MSVQPSQRIKKAAPHQQPHPISTMSAAQAIIARESTPSPSFREKQKAAAKAHIMSQTYNQQPPVRQQPSPTSSNGSRRSPPPPRVSPTAATTLSSSPRDSRDRERNEAVPDRRPSPPMHSISQPNMHHPIPPQGPQHSLSQSNTHTGSNPPHYPRPNRIAPPPFLNQYHAVEESWQMTDQLMAEIERADMQQGQLSSPGGKSGVAYAGGAQSGPISLPKDPNVQRVRAPAERVSPKEFTESLPTNTTVRKAHRNSQSSIPPSGSPQSRTPEHRRSPSYPLTGDPSSQSYAYHEYEVYQSAQARIPTPSGLRQVETLRSSPPPPQTSTNTKFSNVQTPPLSSKTKSPDRSLPVQEEPDDHHDYDPRHQPSPAPSSDVYPEGRPGYDLKPSARGGRDSGGSRRIDDDDSATLNEDMDDDDEDDDNLLKPNGRSDDSSGYTPRSPSVNLPETGPPYHQQTIRARVGAADRVGMRGFDPAMFEQAVEKLKGPTTTTTASTTNSARVSPTQQKEPYGVQQSPKQQNQQPQKQNQQSPQQLHQQPQRPRVYTPGYYPPQHMHPEDFQNFLDDPTGSYLQAYLQSPGARPGAPVPPTPQSQTAAPSPSPLITAAAQDRPMPIGSPYPYPFSHVRRNTYGPGTPSAAYDPNDPAVIREQLALQMQIYALNNAAMSSTESNFSPAPTPFPGPGYNPWAFVPTVRGYPGIGGPNGIMGGGLGGRDNSNMSLRSSPSHEPVSLPLPPSMMMKGAQARLKKKERSMNLKSVQDRLMNGGRTGRSKLAPPRVESTQPRDTSPEMSYSGEETAGEEGYSNETVDDGGKWMNGDGKAGREVVVTDDVTKLIDIDEDEGDWVDEEDEDGDGNDLLDLAFHPSYVRDDQKRRRRWETKWEAVSEAFHALDRQTDATMVLLAAPPHSRKLHSLMSRSIRRDPSLYNSGSISNIRKSFHHVASQRRVSKLHTGVSLVDRLGLRSHSGSISADSGPGSETSSEAREEDLRRALEAALGSLEALGNIYEQRETRWRDEMRRLNNDRQSVEMLLTQTFGQLKASPAMVNGLMEKITE